MPADGPADALRRHSDPRVRCVPRSGLRHVDSLHTHGAQPIILRQLIVSDPSVSSSGFATLMNGDLPSKRTELDADDREGLSSV
jgi:hypothetical protein